MSVRASSVHDRDAGDLDHDLGDGERRRGEEGAGREVLAVDLLAQVGEALRVAAVADRDRHPDDVAQRAAGALQGPLDVLEGLPDLRVEIAGERGAGVVDEADVTGEPDGLAAGGDDGGRV